MMKDWKGWHLHHLARRAKTFGIERPLAEALEKAGWLLTKNKPLPDSLNLQLEKALKRLAAIRNFEKTCENSDCPICLRVIEEYLQRPLVSKPWKLDLELYRWQKEAKQKWWENN